MWIEIVQGEQWHCQCKCIIHLNLTLLQRNKKLITLCSSDMAFLANRGNSYNFLCLLFLLHLFTIYSLEAEALENLKSDKRWFPQWLTKEKGYFCATLSLFALLAINEWTPHARQHLEMRSSVFQCKTINSFLYAYKGKTCYSLSQRSWLWLLLKWWLLLWLTVWC